MIIMCKISLYGFIDEDFAEVSPQIFSHKTYVPPGHGRPSSPLTASRASFCRSSTASTSLACSHQVQQYFMKLKSIYFFYMEVLAFLLDSIKNDHIDS